MKYKAIIFDLDNTLLDYNQSEQTCMQQALEHYRLHEDLTWDEFWSVFGPINFQYWMNRTGIITTSDRCWSIRSRTPFWV